MKTQIIKASQLAPVGAAVTVRTAAGNRVTVKRDGWVVYVGIVDCRSQSIQCDGPVAASDLAARWVARLVAL